MTLLQAKADYNLIQQKPTQWFLHSVYQRTFNLTNESNNQMILVARENAPYLPGGIYLPRSLFEQIYQGLDQLKWAQLEENCLRFKIGEKDIQVPLVPAYNPSLPQGSSALLGKGIFLAKIQNLQQKTGFEIPLSCFAQKEPTPLAKQIAGLFNENQNVKQDSLNYFLGRGPGLTPSGDDFLLGWLFVEQLVFGPTKNNQLIFEKAQSPYYTTDVSRHYLCQASKGRYSQNLLDLANFLQEPTETFLLDELLERLLNYGHSSGADTLAGIAATLIEIEREK